MRSFQNQQPAILVGLDLGTSSVRCIVGNSEEQGDLRILGLGQAPSGGLQKGEVIDLEKTAESIQRAVSEAENTSGLQIESVVAAISGSHIACTTQTGSIRVERDTTPIDEQDIAHLSATVEKTTIGEDIIHILPQSYRLDNLKGIQNPTGLSGNHLEADICVITGATAALQNTYRSIMHAGVDIRDLIFAPLASSNILLTAEEREAGVLMLDIGGGTTDWAVFHRNQLCHTGVVGLGGKNVTNDLAFAFNTTHDRAEQLKRAWNPELPEQIAFKPLTDRAEVLIDKSLITQIIQARMEELFEALYQQVAPTGFLDHLGGGIVITGGGALLWLCAEYASKTSGLSARIRSPQGIPGIPDSPLYSTALGTLLSAEQKQQPVPQTWTGFIKNVRQSYTRWSRAALLP